MTFPVSGNRIYEQNQIDAGRNILHNVRNTKREQLTIAIENLKKNISDLKTDAIAQRIEGKKQHYNFDEHKWKDGQGESYGDYSKQREWLEIHFNSDKAKKIAIDELETNIKAFTDNEELFTSSEKDAVKAFLMSNVKDSDKFDDGIEKINDVFKKIVRGSFKTADDLQLNKLQKQTTTIQDNLTKAEGNLSLAFEGLNQKKAGAQLKACLQLCEKQLSAPSSKIEQEQLASVIKKLQNGFNNLAQGKKESAIECFNLDEKDLKIFLKKDYTNWTNDRENNTLKELRETFKNIVMCSQELSQFRLENDEIKQKHTDFTKQKDLKDIHEKNEEPIPNYVNPPKNQEVDRENKNIRKNNSFLKRMGSRIGNFTKRVGLGAFNIIMFFPRLIGKGFSFIWNAITGK